MYLLDFRTRIRIQWKTLPIFGVQTGYSPSNSNTRSALRVWKGVVECSRVFERETERPSLSRRGVLGNASARQNPERSLTRRVGSRAEKRTTTLNSPAESRESRHRSPRRITAGVSLRERNHNYDRSFFGPSPCLCVCYPSGRFGGTSPRARTAVRAHRSRLLPSRIRSSVFCLSGARPQCLSHRGGCSACGPLRSGE